MIEHFRCDVATHPKCNSDACRANPRWMVRMRTDQRPRPRSRGRCCGCDGSGLGAVNLHVQRTGVVEVPAGPVVADDLDVTLPLPSIVGACRAPPRPRRRGGTARHRPGCPRRPAARTRSRSTRRDPRCHRLHCSGDRISPAGTLKGRKLRFGALCARERRSSICLAAAAPALAGPLWACRELKRLEAVDPG